MARNPWGDNREALREWLSSLPGDMNDERGSGKRGERGRRGASPYVHDLSAPIPMKVVVWGILQQDPKARSAMIAEILSQDQSLVSIYRAELRQR